MLPRPRAGHDERRRQRGGVRWEWLAGLLLFAAAAWWGACALASDRARVADDAYITFHYARNWAEGNGMRYNPGDESPTPGCSTELHLFVSAAAISAGIDPLVATRALSLGAVLLLGALFGLVAARFARATPGQGLLAGGAIAWCLMLLPETRVHLASGMETMLFTLVHGLLFTWAVWTSSRENKPGAAALSSGALLFAAAVLARPEGWILVLLYAAAVVVARVPRAGFSAALRECSLVLLLAVAAVVGLFAWRHGTFGVLFPNPYYVKSDNQIFGSDGALLPGLADTSRFVVLRLLPLLFLLACALRLLALEARVWVAALALFAPALLVLCMYTRVIHEMAGGFRYEYPLLMPFVAALGACSLLQAQRSRRGFQALVVCAVLVLPALAAPVRPALWDYAQHARSAALGWVDARPADNALSRAGRDLAELELGPKATILLSAAGQIPWYSRWRAIDWVGLNETHLSGREALSISQVWAYIEAQNPDVVQSILPPAARLGVTPGEDENFNSANVQTTLRGRGSALFDHWDPVRYREMVWREMSFVRERCEFGACYKLGDAWGDEWWVFLYVRKDSPQRAAILEHLRASKRADRSDLSRAFPFDPRLLAH